MELTGVKVVLLDIEGTVCPISFVKDILFPYALNALPGTAQEKWNDAEFVPYRDTFPEEHKVSPEGLTAHVRDLMSQDVKIAYLKSLQGYLWLSGYESGDLRCPLFSDVAPAMKSWKDQSKKIIIYSSGSVAAQKLLFQYTNSDPADLRPLLTDYFDTVNAGLKQESKSYSKIAAAHSQYEVSSWLFLSDNVKEVDAAREAGMQAAVVVRPGNAPLTSEDISRNHTINSFEEVRLAL